MNEVIIDPAGWWPRWGIGFWVFGDGMVHNNDQTPLDVIPAPGTRPRLLGYTLSGNSAPAVAAAPNGSLAIVNNPDLRNIGRIIWEDKQVEACSPVTGTCTPVPAPPSAVTLDPAWSPDGSHLAYVRAPYRASPAFPQAVAEAWYGAHQLWLYDPASRSARQLDASGASAPAWSPDGKSVLYVARDAIWMLPKLAGQPARIAGPLYPPHHWPLYYGQVNWASQFAWWAGAATTITAPARQARSHRLPAVGAPGFPASVYPPPRPHPVVNSLGHCPAPAGLQPFTPASATAALGVIPRLGRSFTGDLRLTDRTFWPVIASGWQPGGTRVFTPIRPQPTLYSGPLESYHQSEGPPDFTKLIAAGCGARLARNTWMIVEGPRGNPAIQGEFLFLNRRGRILLYYAE